MEIDNECPLQIFFDSHAQRRGVALVLIRRPRKIQRIYRSEIHSRTCQSVYEDIY